MRKTLMTAAVTLVFAGACASTRGPAVADTQLARVPEGELSAVNEQRMAETKARDEVARQQLAVKSSTNEVAVARQEIVAAEAQLKLAQTTEKSASFDRNKARGMNAMKVAQDSQAKLELAQAHERSAQSEVKLNQARLDHSEAQASLAMAQLERSKYQAVKRSGDPEAQKLNPNDFDTRVNDARQKVTRLEQDVRRSNGDYEVASATWKRLQKDSQGLGGSGNAGQ